ncbi:hypothetical protein KC345_g77 [Hortaea werneckii]|nr:hypothetical protein KC345_g77 [Hortaea werneckii]
MSSGLASLAARSTSILCLNLARLSRTMGGRLHSRQSGPPQAKVSCAAVYEVISVYGGQDDVTKSPSCERFCRVLRFMWNRQPRVHVSPMSMMVAVAALLLCAG